MFSNVYLHLITSYETTSIEKKVLKTYIKNLKERSKENQAILCIAVFGSLSRGKFHQHSDLDIRIIRKNGFKNGIMATAFIIKERMIAQKQSIPLEVLLGDSISFLKKMRKDEPPVIIYDPFDKIKLNYNNYLTIENAYKLNKFLD
jgi:predicted nucleotidyltransferase